MAQVRGPIFPPRIIDRILSVAILDGHRLLGYMLLSRECLDRCRRYLFSHFDVYPLLPLQRYIDLFETGNLYDYVEIVTIDGLREKSPSVCLDGGPSEASDHAWVAVAIPVFEKLSNIRGLYLTDLNWQSLSLPARHALGTKFTRATTLSLDGIDFGNSYEIDRKSVV